MKSNQKWGEHIYSEDIYVFKHKIEPRQFYFSFIVVI